MATSGSFLSENQFQCIICLDLYTEPVSIPCGHNFCKACISRHWEDKDQHQCPLCKEKFDKSMKLHVNTGLRDIVENFKEHYATTHEDSPVKPGTVLCDCCPGNKSNASKTCLVCLTSYCEIHLEPHKRVDALKRHKLTNPVRNLEDKICKKHNRIMEICRKDMTRFCILCKEERDQDTVPLQVPFGGLGPQIVRKKVVEQETRPGRGKKGRKKKAPKQTKSQDTGETMEAERIEFIPMPLNPLWRLLNNGPPLCRRYFCIPGHLSAFGGRFYYEVQIAGLRSWDLGVIRLSNQGKILPSPKPSNGNWIIRCRNNTTSMALADNPVPIIFLTKPNRVHVCVDYEWGDVSFYDAETSMWLCAFKNCQFNESVILFFDPSPVEEDWVQWLQHKIHDIDETDKTALMILLCFVIAIWNIWMQNGDGSHTT